MPIRIYEEQPKEVEERRTDIPPQNVLQLLLLELAANDQPLATVHGTAGTQLGEQELRDVLVVPLHALANVGNVCKDGLLVSFPHDLRRRNLVALAAIAGQVGVLAPKEGEEAREKQGVGELDGAGGAPDTGTGDEIAGILGVDFFGGRLLLALLGNETSFRKLGVKVAGGSFGLLLLLLFLQERGIEFTIAGGGLAVLGAGRLLLFLLLETLELLSELGDLLVFFVARGRCRGMSVHMDRLYDSKGVTYGDCGLRRWSCLQCHRLRRQRRQTFSTSSSSL